MSFISQLCFYLSCLPDSISRSLHKISILFENYKGLIHNRTTCVDFRNFLYFFNFFTCIFITSKRLRAYLRDVIMCTSFTWIIFFYLFMILEKAMAIVWCTVRYPYFITFVFFFYDLTSLTLYINCIFRWRWCSTFPSIALLLATQ